MTQISKTTINAVIFDIGNVLIAWRPEEFYDREIGGARRKALFCEVDLDDMNRRIDLGASFKETIEQTALAHPKWASEIHLWYARWIELSQPAIALSVHLLRQLHNKGIVLFALTNFGIDSFDCAEKHYPFLRLFNKRYISGYLGMIKPDTAIFTHVETDCKIAPSTLLFVDDRADNIAQARAHGWQTHLFKTPESWAECLISHGLLTVKEAQIPR